jgi:hypothetical protein
MCRPSFPVAAAPVVPPLVGCPAASTEQAIGLRQRLQPARVVLSGPKGRCMRRRVRCEMLLKSNGRFLGCAEFPTPAALVGTAEEGKKP